LQQFGEVLQAWMLSQIPGRAGGLDHLVCDGKHRFVAQVRLYAFCARRRSGAEELRHPGIQRKGSPARRVLGPGYVLRMGTIEGLHHLDGAACTVSGASSGQRFTQVVTAEQACPQPRRHLTVCAI
jgi:hypothetical protein